MWVVRELSRFVEKIVIAVLIAIVIAELRTLISGGDRMHAFQISLLLLGAAMIALGAMSPNSNYSRRADVMTRYWDRRIGVTAQNERFDAGPTLTPIAVFVASGLIVIVLGFAI